MCPFANTTNIILIVSMIVIVLALDFGRKKVADPKTKKLLTISYYTLYALVFGFVVFVFFKNRIFV